MRKQFKNYKEFNDNTLNLQSKYIFQKEGIFFIEFVFKQLGKIIFF
jgi:hypothetical protein